MGIRWRRRAVAVAVAVAAVTVTGCATSARLDDQFDADAVGGTPSASPPPNPPADSMTVTKTQNLIATVASAPSGGNWLRIVPDATFTSSPDQRKMGAIAVSAPFTASPPASIRGHLRMRLDGLGTVTVGIRPSTSGSGTPDFIGGFGLARYGLAPGQVYLIGPFAPALLGGLPPLPSAGMLAPYGPSTVVDIIWSIDQGSRTLSASVGGGAPVSATFPAVTAGTATTPFATLSFWFYLERPTPSTALFIDNVYAEEY